MAAAWEAARSSVSWQAVKDGWSSKWFQGSKDGSMVALQSDFVGVLGEYLRRHHSGMLALLHRPGSLLHKGTHTEDASPSVTTALAVAFPIVRYILHITIFQVPPLESVLPGSCTCACLLHSPHLFLQCFISRTDTAQMHLLQPVGRYVIVGKAFQRGQRLPDKTRNKINKFSESFWKV